MYGFISENINKNINRTSFINNFMFSVIVVTHNVPLTSDRCYLTDFLCSIFIIENYISSLENDEEVDRGEMFVLALIF